MMDIHLRRLVLLASLCLPPFASAMPFGGSGAGVYRSIQESPDRGLCMSTPSNLTQPQFTQGYCKRLSQLMSETPCLREKIEQLRTAAQSQPPIQDMQEYCPDFRTISSDNSKWHLFLLNFFGAIITEESNWNAGITAAVANPSTGKYAKGIGQLSAESVQAYKCGCDEISTDNDLFNSDKSLKCTADVALTNMLKEPSALGDGQSKNSIGAARYFEVVRASSPKREKIAERMKHYCSASAGHQPEAIVPAFLPSNGPMFSPMNDGTPTAI